MIVNSDGCYYYRDCLYSQEFELFPKLWIRLIVYCCKLVCCEVCVYTSKRELPCQLSTCRTASKNEGYFKCVTV